MFDLYVNDAFAAAHRSSPSMVAFQQVLPTCGGEQLVAEYSALSRIASDATHPCTFVLGGAKISDAFGMMRNVLAHNIADRILTTGVTALVMLLAQGVSLGEKTMQFLEERDLIHFIKEAKALLTTWPEQLMTPSDLAYEDDGKRAEASITTIHGSAELQKSHFFDVGRETINAYTQVIADSGTVFINGPAGVYEDSRWEAGTKTIWRAIADAPGYTVVGGGDTITAAARFTDLSRYSYVCTAGGAMIRFLSGKKLPLIEAMEQALLRETAQKE